MPEDHLHGGHLFVVHGRIESLVHDAAIVPVGSEFWFSPSWTALVGPSPTRPVEWGTRGWGRLVDAPDRVWAVSVGGTTADPIPVIIERVLAVLSRVDKRRDAHQPRRGVGTRPLVAVPVIGTGLGGNEGRRGEVLNPLLRALTDAARDLDLDVALVTPSASAHAAAQYARRTLRPTLPGTLEEAARDLGQAARRGELALFTGAGVSIPAGLPSWGQLIEMLAEEYDLAGLGIQQNLDSAIDQAELIEKSANGKFQRRVAELTSQSTQPSLLHALLAGLDCREVVTTNYDVLYEQAVAATGRGIASVMPWASAQGARRWILKFHGDVEHPEKIVLTRRHMVRYDAANRPSAALLQSLLLTKRLLVVGASMTDDNVVRLAHEVQEYRQRHQNGGEGTFGTVLDTAGDSLRKRLWEGQLDWLELPSLGPWPGPRAVELFLDAVGFHASRDSSWLLDERFSGLLDEQDAVLAEQVRSLYAALSARGVTKWSPLVERMRELGADSRDH